MKLVYLVSFDNGEDYAEDYSEWIDDKVYLSKDDCIQSLLDKGYVYDMYSEYFDRDYYTLDMEDEWCPDQRATIFTLEVI